MLQLAFEFEGWDVTVLNRGEQVVDVCTQLRPRAVVLDVMMPDMDGLQVLRQIRQRPGLRDLPVLLLSARVLPEDIFDGWLSGADAYVTKPMNLRALVAEVDRIVAARAAA